MHRKRYNGRLESFPTFERRKFCGEECAGVGRRAVNQGAVSWRHDPIQRLAAEGHQALRRLNRQVERQQRSMKR